MVSIKTVAALVVACQMAKAVDLERVQQTTVLRNGELHSLESMIEDKIALQPFDVIHDAKTGKVNQIEADLSL